MNFNDYNLDERINKAIGFLKYTEPTKVQQEVIPRLLAKKNVVVKSETGSGKTASYGIPLCDIVDEEKSEIEALILVPTRELALQVKEELGSIGRIKKVRTTAIFGKQPFKEQERELKQRVHIVAGTPGRVMDHIKRGNLKLNALKYVIIDEADKMLNMGFIDQVQDILRTLPAKRVMAMFSATIPEELEGVCKKHMGKYEVVEIENEKKERNITESYLKIDNDNKARLLLKELYGLNPDAAMVFCNTKDKVREVYEFLRKNKVSVNELHGDMDQKSRIQTMNDFKNGKFRVLVATDIAARGIDVDQVTHVFNYEVPMEQESYVHRIGRTGRAGRRGTAITFMAQWEEKFLKSVEEFIGYKIPLGAFPDDEAVRKGKELFLSDGGNTGKATVRKDKVQKEVTKIYLGAGKKKKIRTVDIVGALSNLPEITSEDIGIIDVQDQISYVDILNNKGKKLLKNYSQITIKGKSVRLEEARK